MNNLWCVHIPCFAMLTRTITFLAVVAAALASTGGEDVDLSEELKKDGFTTYLLEDVILSIIENMRNQLREGIPEQNIPPLDPLKIENRTFDINYEDQLILNGSLKNVRGQNLLGFNVTALKLSLSPLFFELGLAWNPIDAHGLYDVDGSIFKLIPIYGNGNFRGTLEGIFVYIRIDIGPKAGELYVKKLNLNFGIRNVQVNMTNFLGGLMGDIICEIINENFPTMVEQFKIGYLGEMKSVIVNELNAFLKGKTVQDILDFIMGLKQTTPQPTSTVGIAEHRRTL